MPKTKKIIVILIALIVILIIALFVVIYWQEISFESPYWAVYLDTGDVYFGKPHWFPRFNLTDVWFLQRNTNNTENPLSLTKFSQAFWQPEDKIYLNGKNIIWKTKLKDDSQIVQYIKDFQASQNQQSTQPSTQPQP